MNMLNLKRRSEVKVPQGKVETKKYLDTVPDPVGYRILVRPWTGKAKTDGGIILTDKTQETKEVTTVVGLVVKMGELCYKDKDKFGDIPWCEEKHWVLIGRYAGARFKLGDDAECRIINDDEVIATISDPDDIVTL